MTQKHLLIPLPSYGFDPSEAAIPWKIFSENGFKITFATPNGAPAKADQLMLNGTSLGVWKPVLQARKDAVEAYQLLEKSPEFAHPLPYAALTQNDFDALFLPGGHDKGVREYLESDALQQLVVAFFDAQKPVAAICHGVVLAARSIDPATGKSVLFQRKTTALLKTQELLAYNLTRLWLGDYYLTYPGLTVEDEVREALADKRHFQQGPMPVFRDSPENLGRGFFVRDGNYLSARWPGDAYAFSMELMKMMRG